MRGKGVDRTRRKRWVKEAKARRYRLREIPHGPFVRTFALPVEAKADEVCPRGVGGAAFRFGGVRTVALFATICVRSGGYGQAEEGRRDRMRVTYDERADALYIAFGEGPATVQEVAEGIALDWDGEGKLLGIEILDASERVANAEVLKRRSQEG